MPCHRYFALLDHHLGFVKECTLLYKNLQSVNVGKGPWIVYETSLAVISTAALDLAVFAIHVVLKNCNLLDLRCLLYLMEKKMIIPPPWLAELPLKLHLLKLIKFLLNDKSVLRCIASQ